MAKTRQFASECKGDRIIAINDEYHPGRTPPTNIKHALASDVVWQIAVCVTKRFIDIAAMAILIKS